MSQYMQIDIRILPYYETRFEKQFPRIAELLKSPDDGRLLSGDVSFYEMTDLLDFVAENRDTPSDVRQVITPHVRKIVALKETAREHLLARRLNELDRILYRMEDAFEDLEGAL